MWNPSSQRNISDGQLSGTYLDLCVYVRVYYIAKLDIYFLSVGYSFGNEGQPMQRLAFSWINRSKRISCSYLWGSSTKKEISWHGISENSNALPLYKATEGWPQIPRIQGPNNKWPSFHYNFLIEKIQIYMFCKRTLSILTQTNIWHVFAFSKA